MSKKEIIELMKSGNFSLHYHDNGYCTIHKGKKKYGEFGDIKSDKHNLPEYSYGYVPSEVTLLVEALGGIVDSV